MRDQDRSGPAQTVKPSSLIRLKIPLTSIAIFPLGNSEVSEP